MQTDPEKAKEFIAKLKSMDKSVFKKVKSALGTDDALVMYGNMR